MKFTPEEQLAQRDTFIRECRQKAWGARCHADWVAKGLDRVLADYTKLKEEDAALEEEIKTLSNAVDSHTFENRKKRKDLQERRTSLGNAMQSLAKNVQEGQKALTALHQSIEASLQLAEHAREWSWEEPAQRADAPVEEAAA